MGTGQQVTLKRNEEYWGDKAKVATAVIRVIGDGTARRQALQNGDIDGYDLVAPADVETLKSADFQIQNRPAFNILYLGINQAYAPLGDLKVRQAIAHAIDKEAVIKNALPEGTKPATQFMPDNVIGWNESVTTYEYDVAKAKQLLAEAGQSAINMPFNYPTGVSRPYMPNPETIYNAINQQLTAPASPRRRWPSSGRRTTSAPSRAGRSTAAPAGVDGRLQRPGQLHRRVLRCADERVGLQRPRPVRGARQGPDRDDRVRAGIGLPGHQRADHDAAAGIPIASPVPSLAFAPGVDGYTASPVQDEVWNTVSVSGS